MSDPYGFTRNVCDSCGQPVSLNAGSGSFVQAVGWYELRPKGANQTSLRKDTGWYRCKSCMAAIKAGIDPERQERLL